MSDFNLIQTELPELGKISGFSGIFFQKSRLHIYSGMCILTVKIFEMYQKTKLALMTDV